MEAKKIKIKPQVSLGRISVLDGTKAYIELRRKVTSRGILDRDYASYTLLTLVTFFGFFFSVYEIYITTISLQLLGWCLLLGFFTVQFGGLMHDAVHKAIMKSVKM